MLADATVCAGLKHFLLSSTPTNVLECWHVAAIGGRVHERPAARRARRAKPRRYAVATALALALASTWHTPSAHADENPTPLAGGEPHTGLSRVFVTGSSLGEPSTGKLVTLYGFYGAALGSLVVSSVALVAHLDAKEQADDFLRKNSSPAPCFDLTSLRCEELERLRGDERRNATFASLSLAAAGTFVLSGLFTAQYWENVQPTLATSTNGASFHVRVTF